MNEIVHDDGTTGNPTNHDVRTLLMLAEPGALLEVRAFPAAGGPAESGCFAHDGVAQAAVAAAGLDARGYNVYATLNPVKPSTLARLGRRPNVVARGGATKDDDVARRRWVLFDIDPVREAGGKVAATDAEKAAALRLADKVADHLADCGAPADAVMLWDSGNGYYLLLAVDLPADDGGLVEAVVKGTADRFKDHPGASIDRSVFNASRILRLPGTVNKKGDDTPERPWRRAAVVRVPDQLAVCPREVLEQMAEEWRQRQASQQTPAPSLPQAPRPAASGDRSRLLARVRGDFEKWDPAVEGEDGSKTAVRIASRIYNGWGLSEAETWELLREWNQRCQPQWEEWELRRKLDKAVKDGHYNGRPRGCLAADEGLPAGQAGQEGAGVGRERRTDVRMEDLVLGPCAEWLYPDTLRLAYGPDDDWLNTPAPAGGDGASTPPPGRRGLLVTTLDQVEAKEVEWVWPGRWPRGALVDLSGDPGLGKSQLYTSVAACLTRGWALPFEPRPIDWPEGKDWPPPEGEQVREPADVVILAAEDDPNVIIRPRFEAAGADLKRVHLVQGTGRGEKNEPVILPKDIDLVEGLARRLRPALVVADPVTAYVGSDVDTNNDASTRTVTSRLNAMAQATGACVAMVRHLNKDEKKSALYRGSGSIAFVGNSRAAFVLGSHPKNKGARVMACVKMNVAQWPAAVTFTVVPTGKVSRVEWGQETDLTADEMLRPPGGRKASRSTSGQDAVAWLRQRLAGGPRSARELQDEAKADMLSAAALRHAKERLEVRAVQRRVGDNSQWFWGLPPDDLGEPATSAA